MKTNKQYCKPQAEVIDLLLGTLMQQASPVGVTPQVIDEEATESAWTRHRQYTVFDDDENLDE